MTTDMDNGKTPNCNSNEVHNPKFKLV